MCIRDSIHPCGFIDKGVTSLRQELKHDVPMDEVKQRLEEELRKLLDVYKRQVLACFYKQIRVLPQLLF